MVIRKNMSSRYALISVYNKSGLEYLCKNLYKNNFKFISTGSTCKKIKSLGYNCLEVSKITNFKEILDGRVKTLNPKIYGSILFKRDNSKHIEEFKQLKTPIIDIVVINLYPFEKFVQQNNNDEIIEMIDIGGPSLLRASSKNFKYVTTISKINDYKKLIKNLNINNGKTDIYFRKKMASSAFQITATYDKIISQWFKKKTNKKIKKKLRYGENPNQNSFIVENHSKKIFDHQINGKEISYNNIIDIDSGLKCLNEFKKPTCVIIKHNNPCAVASSDNINLAFKKAMQSDSKSAFGGIVLLNRTIDKNLSIIISKYFFEVIVAPNYNIYGLNILQEKKRLILLKMTVKDLQKLEFKSTIFGTIYQTIDSVIINKNFFKLVSNKDAGKKNIDDLIFATKVVKHLKSNAIVLASNEQTCGIGTGQTNRVDSLKIALKKCKETFKNKKFVCSSDGFFPFTDSLKLLKKNNCNIVAQPAGSIKDDENIKYSIKNRMSLYFSKNRIFKH